MSTGMYEWKKDKINRTHQASSWIEFMGGEIAPDAEGAGKRRYINREQMKIKRH